MIAHLITPHIGLGSNMVAPSASGMLVINKDLSNDSKNYKINILCFRITFYVNIYALILNI